MDRVALITGASSDIGAAAARAFSRAGYAVALAARRMDVLERLKAEIEEEGGDALTIEADVTEPADVAKTIALTTGTYGGIDAAFNNAGSGTSPAPLAQLDLATFEDALKVNVRGTFLCMSAEIKAMLLRGGGSIVNMSSTAGLQGVAGLSPYCAGKHAIIGMSRAAALDYADSGIRINVVAPGPIATERIAPEHRERIGMWVPVKRIGDPMEVGYLVRWLCSEESRFVTGTVVPVDGGRLAGTPAFASGR